VGWVAGRQDYEVRNEEEYASLKGCGEDPTGGGHERPVTVVMRRLPFDINSYPAIDSLRTAPARSRAAYHEQLRRASDEIAVGVWIHGGVDDVKGETRRLANGRR
jgi:hypothetical protein